jgi:uncharacterized protein (DUF1501 family)
MFNRRHFLALGSSGLLLPRRLLAAKSKSERKFFFIYCYGGWDTTMVYTPEFDNSNIDMEADAEQTEANGITFVTHESRPAVQTFFETYGDRCCVINGMEVRSVTHERCQRLLFTGTSDADADDWGVLMASNTAVAYPVPHLVLSGPAFSAENMANVVRVGEVGQLVDLMDGSALSMTTQGFPLPVASAEALEDSFVRARIERFQAAHASGSQARFGQLYGQAIDNLETLNSMAGDVDLASEAAGCRRDIAADAAVAFNAFEAGLARCSLTRDDGWCSITWDTHTSNSYQAMHYEDLYGYLNSLMADLDTRTGQSGAPLRDEVTIVVFSEMGRHPQLTSGGRGHWTFTSALLIGSGVQGGQVIGAMNENFEGMPVDLATGALDSKGSGLLPSHLGATLLQLADIDPAEFVTQVGPLTAALEP